MVAHHPQHPQAFAALRSIADRAHQGYIATHSLAEVYAVLTRLPVKPAIHSSEAVLMIRKNVIEHCEAVELKTEDYEAVLSVAAERGWRRGSIYDALILQCARKVQAERIHTFNLGDFRRLAPDLIDRICIP
jgi:predicted nucleic acid-binding protein